jgi:hypothetical protein
MVVCLMVLGLEGTPAVQKYPQLGRTRVTTRMGEVVENLWEGSIILRKGSINLQKVSEEGIVLGRRRFGNHCAKYSRNKGTSYSSYCRESSHAWKIAEDISIITFRIQCEKVGVRIGNHDVTGQLRFAHGRNRKVDVARMMTLCNGLKDARVESSY